MQPDQLSLPLSPAPVTYASCIECWAWAPRGPHAGPCGLPCYGGEPERDDLDEEMATLVRSHCRGYCDRCGGKEVRNAA